MSEKKRALGLFSGGLDSMLAAAVLREQGIEVAGAVFITPFFGAERARESAAHLNLPLIEQDITDIYYPLLVAPPHGFGSRHNPCIDCHILMLRGAGALMEARGFSHVRLRVRGRETCLELRPEEWPIFFVRGLRGPFLGVLNSLGFEGLELALPG